MTPVKNLQAQLYIDQNTIDSSGIIYYWPVWPGVLPVQVVEFFVHQYIRKEQVNMLKFLHGDNHQGK